MKKTDSRISTVSTKKVARSLSSQKKPVKVLIVSDAAHFALTDVYYGYVHAFEKLGIEYVAFPLHLYLQHHKEHICFSVIHSEAMIKENGYTHVMFIGGLNIPRKILQSFHGIVKTVVIATEDPHTFDPLKDSLDCIDYYCSNERALLKLGYDNVHYLPTAADPQTCGSIPKHALAEKYRSDIVFLGAIYPNRQKMLEGIIPFIRKNHLKLKILGHPQYVPKNSPVWEFVPPENYDTNGNVVTIPHEETIKYYCGASIVLNFFRDVSWNPVFANGKNPFNSKKIVAESLNPRAYEVPMCGSLMFLEGTREESRDVFTNDEVAFFNSVADLKKLINTHLLKAGSHESTCKMTSAAFKKVSLKHTYVNRAQELLRIIS